MNRKAKPSQKFSEKPFLSPLEERCVPAAFTFNDGVLTINMTEIQNRFVSVTAGNGNLILNGRQAGGPTNHVLGAPNGKPPLASITSIVVNGSEQRDSINLQGVDTQFNNLDGRVIVYGKGGDDTIYGSQFADKIFAGAGNDRIIGGGGNDRIFGEAGADEIFGDGNSGYWNTRGGDDYLDGGSGDDRILGSGGNDTLIGGPGKDSFWGDLGFDVVHFAKDDAIPPRGWGWAGIEKAIRA